MSPSTVPNPAKPTGRRRWLAFSAALIATMMNLLDATILNVAAPVIRDDLGGSYADLQWLTAAYTLTMAVGLLLGGRLGDLFGRKRMLLGGVAGFAAASAACAAAPTVELLIAGRVVQAAFAAVMVPQVFGLLRDLFEPEEMGKAWAILGPVAGLSAMLGPVVSGVLIDGDPVGLGWRTVFLVNLPVAAYVVAVGARHLPDVAPAVGSRALDLPGLVLAGLGTGGLVFPLVQGREQGWPAWTFAMLAGAVLVLTVFGRRQVARRRAGRATLVEPSLFCNRAYVSGATFALLFLGTMGGIALVLTGLLQLGLGFSPVAASLTCAPYALGGFLGSGVGGAFKERVGRSFIHAGLVVMGTGLAGVAAVCAHAGTDLGAWDLVLPLLVAGVGMGMVFVLLFDIILGGVAPHEMGSASGMLEAVQQFGMALGVAIVGTVFFGLVEPGTAATASFVHAAEVAALLTVGLLAVAFVLAFRLPRGAHAASAGAAVAQPA